MSAELRIFQIQRFCLQDGGGIRTTVFLQGCPLDCLWCHNPEAIEGRIRLWRDKNRCIECGSCTGSRPEEIYSCSAACPTGALSLLTQEEFLARQEKERQKKARLMMTKQLDQ